ncbi:MAG: 3-phosphoshikimate 1-carboxyvinyltransferase [Holophagaceae bacterium]|nr:3-phosphoshikimate 1-carboxyvinyltransferase [Holophagaceae bacterium]
MLLSLPRDTFLAEGAPLRGVPLPGSKSVTNRALLLAALAPGTSVLRGGLEAEDTRWMRSSLRTLGTEVDEAGGSWRVRGGVRPATEDRLWLGASGTSLRFLLPWLALHGIGEFHLAGEPRLFERPLGPLLTPLTALGARWTAEGGEGLLRPVPQRPDSLDAEVDGTLSSQFITGLALAAAGLPGGGILRWSRPPASPSYLALTCRWLQAFGCAAALHEDRLVVPGSLRAADLDLPADWSGAAAFLAAAAVTGRALTLGPLDAGDAQGDRALVAILVAAGCEATWEGTRLTLRGPLRRGLHADLEACPDLGPVLAATAALAPDPSVLTGLQTLPLKECDRLNASAELVRWLGGQAEVVGDHTLRISPGPPPAARAPFNPRNDHRMAFAAAVGALRTGGELEDPDCVAKTFPEFWSAWDHLLGGVP